MWVTVMPVYRGMPDPTNNKQLRIIIIISPEIIFIYNSNILRIYVQNKISVRNLLSNKSYVLIQVFKLYFFIIYLAVPRIWKMFV